MKKKTLFVVGMIGALLLGGCGAKASDMTTAPMNGGYFTADSAAEDVYYSKSEALMVSKHLSVSVTNSLHAYYSPGWSSRGAVMEETDKIHHGAYM